MGLFGTLILAACPALLAAQIDSGRITGNSFQIFVEEGLPDKPGVDRTGQQKRS
jgi:hypothetical protein